MSNKLLLVDDNLDILSFVKPALESAGFIVETATRGHEALGKVKGDESLILLDVMLPEVNGFDICKRIRDVVKCPIVFLTARELEEEKLKGFMAGGDDYIVKPFSLVELIARIHAHIRREERGRIPSEKIHFISYDIVLDVVKRSVKRNGVEIELTKKEFDIIELLATNTGQVFSKEQIFEKIWGYDSDSYVTTVTEHIKRIRAKFMAHAQSFDCIKTVWGIGYKWEFLHT